jgi:hypothetical protein
MGRRRKPGTVTRHDNVRLGARIVPLLADEQSQRADPPVRPVHDEEHADLRRSNQPSRNAAPENTRLVEVVVGVPGSSDPPTAFFFYEANTFTYAVCTRLNSTALCTKGTFGGAVGTGFQAVHLMLTWLSSGSLTLGGSIGGTSFNAITQGGGPTLPSGSTSVRMGVEEETANTATFTADYDNVTIDRQ